MKAVGLSTDYICVMCVYVQYSMSSCSHHIKHEHVDVEVGLLLHTADDAALDHGAATLHLQARGGNAGQLETLQVANAPRYDLQATRESTVNQSFNLLNVQ